MAQFIDLIVYRRILFDIGIGIGYICLRLIIIVVRYKILDGILGEEFPEFGAQLSRQGFVVGEHQGRTVDLGDNIGHGKRLARSRNTEQNLFLESFFDPFGQLFNRLWADRRSVYILKQV